MPNRQQAGPPPVQQSGSVPSERALSVAAENYSTIEATLKGSRGAEARQIQSMFGGDKDLMNRFLAVAFASLAGNNDLLMNCEPMSVVQAIKDAASLGLEPTGLGGEGAIIRYKTKATFQPMWRGYLKRIRNSGKVLDVDCQIVYMNDEFRITLGTEPSIHHVPILYGERADDGSYIAERGDYRGVYAWALMPSGLRIIEYATTDDINAVRDHFSQAWKSDKSNSPWATSWPEMARKTVIRRLAKRLPGEAVDRLLIVDARADQQAEQVATPSVSVSAAQRLALAAVSGTPEPGTESEPEAAQGGSETERDDVEGAMTAQQVAYVRGETDDPGEPPAGLCGAASPYTEGDSCNRAAGHPTTVNHRGSDGSTWS